MKVRSLVLFYFLHSNPASVLLQRQLSDLHTHRVIFLTMRLNTRRLTFSCWIVITGTGPSAFTNAIVAEMSAVTGRSIDWEYFTGLTEPRFVGGILVLTVKAFAAGQGHSNSGFHNATEVLAKHHYHASGWPKKHPRYLHPVYREVELCNWKPDCVQAWDRNTTEFATFPKEKQDVMIAEAEAAYQKDEDERVAREQEDADRANEDRIREEHDRICGPPPAQYEPEPPREEPQVEEQQREDIPKLEDTPKQDATKESSQGDSDRGNV